jgi:hypothetical protein
LALALLDSPNGGIGGMISSSASGRRLYQPEKALPWVEWRRLGYAPVMRLDQIHFSSGNLLGDEVI